MANQVYHIAALTDHLADAIDAARLATTDKRWRSAIDAGASWLLEQDVITFDATRHELTVNSPSGKIYKSNGACQCEAFAQHNACWHRAAARICRRALELQQRAALPGLVVERLTAARAARIAQAERAAAELFA
jgi:hypothetical protein